MDRLSQGQVAMIDASNDPALTSWCESAQGSDFPIQNLPLGIFSVGERRRRAGVAIGDYVLDLSGIADLLDEDWREDLSQPVLNGWLARGPEVQSALRLRLIELLTDEKYRDDVEPQLVGQTEGRLHVPCLIGDYTDFYVGIHHATNVGKQFRPDNPLLPNYKYVPIGYHGRASSIVPSGSAVERPKGQTRSADAAAPEFGPSRSLDYELEVGCYIGVGNALGEPVPVARAESHLFGLCLVNDWSARDVQACEHQPLGPFLAKNFGTTVSPWVVTLEALAPFRAPAYPRADGDPPPLPYLADARNAESGGIALTLEVWLRSAAMRQRGAPAVRLSRGSFTDMYWTLAQLVAHHSSNGCNLRTGDLLASGTVSGAARDARGCMLELTWRGTEPVAIGEGETRAFLEDGDEVILRGRAERDGAVGIGFGECAGTVAPSRA
jgi:fumarylacetoacetase